jgi:hypothetical protein
MRCIQCERPAVALCHVCLVAQCEVHVEESRRNQKRTGALAGCNHGTVATAGVRPAKDTDR